MSTNARSFFLNTLLVVASTVICLVLIEGSAYFIVKTHDSGYYEPDFKNSLGLRDPREPTDVRGESVVLVLGDSFTYGLGVRFEDSYPAQLEASLRLAQLDVAVVNAGNPGFDTQMAYDRLLAVYKHYEPDCVILGFHSADIVQNKIVYSMLDEGIVTQKLEGADEHEIRDTVKQREADIPKLYLIKNYVRKSSNTGALIDYLYKNYMIKYLPPPERVQNFGSGADFAATEYFLDQINDFLSEKKKKFILLNIIPLVRFDAYPYGRLSEQLEEYAESRNILFINPLEEFSNSKFPSGELWVSMSDAHYNAHGQRVISDILERSFTEQLAGTCTSK